MARRFFRNCCSIPLRSARPSCVPSTGYRYALRVNPSSGNLHPTEFHFRTRGLKEWPDGLYHYRPSSHMAEQRARGDFELAGSAPIVFVLTSIAWREAWKYRDRAYRYCLHDIGHAWQALALAARAIGCETFARSAISRTMKSRSPAACTTTSGPCLSSNCVAAAHSRARTGRPRDALVRRARESAFEGKYRLTRESTEIHAATKLSSSAAASSTLSRLHWLRRDHAASPLRPRRPFGEVARTRRSALDFVGGTQSMSLPQLSAILAAATQPFRC